MSEKCAPQAPATFASAKSPDALFACMPEAWTNQERWPITPDVRINPIANGTQVRIYNSHGMSSDVFADNTRDGESRRIRYYAGSVQKVVRRSHARLLVGSPRGVAPAPLVRFRST